MVEVFNVIAKAAAEKTGKDPGERPADASAKVKKTMQSGSAKFYGDALSNTAEKFKSKQIPQENILDFVQTLLGGESQAVAVRRRSRAGIWWVPCWGRLVGRAIRTKSDR